MFVCEWSLGFFSVLKKAWFFSVGSCYTSEIGFLSDLALAIAYLGLFDLLEADIWELSLDC